MKLKKNISKIITLSILFNNICFYSNASSLSRYKTLEGEAIALNNVKDKDITEIEIFGNTVQDPSNLEDIQSVGDLYVDEEGEPILDELGREQYKVEIETYNSNILKKELFERTVLSNGVINYSFNVDVDTLFPSKALKYKFIRNKGSNVQCLMYEYDKDGKQLSANYWYWLMSYDFTINQDTKYFKMVIRPMGSNSIYNEDVDTYFNEDYDMRITIDANTPYTPNQSSKTTILLPSQLMKVGNIADKLYWDSKKGKYIIEKNVTKTNIVPEVHSIEEPGTLFTIVNLYKKSIGINNHKSELVWTEPILNTVIGSNYYDIHGEIENSGAFYSEYLRLRIKNTDLLSLDKDGFIKWLTENPTYIIYPSYTELIETNITEKIKLSIYPEKTCISTSGKSGSKPILKVTIDRIEQVSQEAVDIALSNTTSSNIALARMFVNMLSDSLYKDQLQEKLNELFSEDIFLDKKSASANIDLYIKSENILQMSLNTNSITFDDFSGVEDMTKDSAVNISINSSLPYNLNSYLVTDIQNSDKSNTMNLDILNIKENSEINYQKFSAINNKLILKSNCESGNNKQHNIYLKLNAGVAHEKDAYKTTIKFESEQI